MFRIISVGSSPIIICFNWLYTPQHFLIYIFMLLYLLFL